MVWHSGRLETDDLAALACELPHTGWLASWLTRGLSGVLAVASFSTGDNLGSQASRLCGCGPTRFRDHCPQRDHARERNSRRARRSDLASDLHRRAAYAPWRTSLAK